LEVSVLDRKEQIGELLANLNALRRMVMRHRASYLKQRNLTHSQMWVLHVVQAHDGIKVKEIADLLGITGSAATQLADALVKKGYLSRERSPEDRRALKVRLSEQGKKQVCVPQTEHLGKLFDVLDDGELLQYCELSKKIINRILERKRGEVFEKEQG
jgi:DNA-binding MarR family transcriptional regulator